MNRPPRKSVRKTRRVTNSANHSADELRGASQKARRELSDLQESIQANELVDQCWYYGNGVNCVAVWDAQAGCFWTIAFEGGPKPAQGRRPILRKEASGSETKEGFRPIAILERPF